MARPHAATSEANYLLQIELMGISDPSVTRTLSVPASTTFYTLHCAIQVAFDWRNCHLHRFEILDTVPSGTGSEPYRGIFDPKPRILLALEPDPESGDYDGFGPFPENSKQFTLQSLFENETYKNKKIEYQYDFGDHWNHSVTLIGRALSKTRHIICLSGEGGPVAEDCGGVHGWKELKDVFAEHANEIQGECNEPEAHEKMKWYKSDCHNGRKAGLDPSKWDKATINKEFAKTNGLLQRIALAAE